ncbi:CopY family transcriptional regulator [Catenovulum agarivorans DS-2]|uniref:CopY family transcriptional regulator n=1 Tax=Catenovulum agarivorans DS-2 TaxID=1328313 RepID=W7QHK2_9ALTE|nr:BlaI/MecI/CopY family transcriptional regulator [Catenovulum agarivorans]EWH11356.1 CopY family transcriptional regulator [Catenovulum agarivorans DS-2]
MFFSKSLSNWLNQHRNKPSLPALGAREIQVLKLFWTRESANAQQILAAVGQNDTSLSTIQSTLERLYRKELLNREKIGRSYHYSANISQQQVVHQLLKDISHEISDGNLAPMISGFMDFIAEQDDQHNSRKK